MATQNKNFIVKNGLEASSTVTSLDFYSTASSGDEGGEIRLNKPVTNTSITTGVTIDVYQNKFRIFETGGTNRGAYIDLTDASAGVASNLLTGGASSSTISTGTTAPGSPSVGQLWFNTETTRMYIYYDSYWVEASSPVAAVGQFDGGLPSTTYGGIAPIDGGSV